MSYIIGGIITIVVIAVIASWSLISDYKSYENLPETTICGTIEGKNSIENYYDISFPMTVYFVTIRCQDGKAIIADTNYQTFVMMEKNVSYKFTLKGDSVIDVEKI